MTDSPEHPLTLHKPHTHAPTVPVPTPEEIVIPFSLPTDLYRSGRKGKSIIIKAPVSFTGDRAELLTSLLRPVIRNLTGLAYIPDTVAKAIHAQLPHAAGFGLYLLGDEAVGSAAMLTAQGEVTLARKTDLISDQAYHLIRTSIAEHVRTRIIDYFTRAKETQHRDRLRAAGEYYSEEVYKLADEKIRFKERRTAILAQLDALSAERKEVAKAVLASEDVSQSIAKTCEQWGLSKDEILDRACNVPDRHATLFLH